MYNKSLILEGGDGVGKNHLAVNLVKTCLANEEQVILTNFPQYWFFGQDIRRMNRVIPVKQTMSQMDGYREAAVRSAMYALDRAFGLSFILQILEKYPDAIHISDRGPLSNAVTAGFMWSQGRLTTENISQFVRKVIGTVDKEVMGVLQPISILCRNQKLETDASFHREILDDLEKPDPQKFALKVYDMLNLPTLYTTGQAGWRDIEDLSAECFSHTNWSIDTSIPIDHIDMEAAISSEQLMLIGPNILNSFGNQTEAGILSANQLPTWTKLSVLPEAELFAQNIIHQGAAFWGERKIALDTHEDNISPIIKWAVAVGHIKLNIHPIAREAIARILTEYPEILSIVLPATCHNNAPEFVGYMQKLASLES